MVLRLCAFQKATEIQWILYTRQFFSKFSMLRKRKPLNSVSFSLDVYRPAIDLIWKHLISLIVLKFNQTHCNCFYSLGLAKTNFSSFRISIHCCRMTVSSQWRANCLTKWNWRCCNFLLLYGSFIFKLHLCQLNLFIFCFVAYLFYFFCMCVSVCFLAIIDLMK